MDYKTVIVHDKDWNRIAYIDTYTSLIWTRKFSDCGDFELYLPFKKRYMEYLKVKNYITLEDDPFDAVVDADGTIPKNCVYAMIIERVEVEQDESGSIMMTVTGRSLASILYRRVLYHDVIMGTGIEVTPTKGEFVKRLIDLCFGVGEYSGDNFPARQWKKGNGSIPYYTVVDLTTDKKKEIHTAMNSENLGDVLREFCVNNSLGIDIQYCATDTQGGEVDRYYIIISQGTDRSGSVFFRRDLDNLSNAKYVEDISNYANGARVTFTNTETHQVYTTSGIFDLHSGTTSISIPSDVRIIEGGSGLDRYEVFLTTSVSSDASNYDERMKKDILRQLSAMGKTTEVSAEIIDGGTYKIGRDYSLGDTVTISTDFGVTVTARIAEIAECWDTSGHSIVPTFERYSFAKEEES